MQIAVIGLDLAKNVFQVHGIDDSGQAAVTPSIHKPFLHIASMTCRFPPATEPRSGCGSNGSSAKRGTTAPHP
jgi:hypothetical protein